MRHIYRITCNDRNPKTGERNFINFECHAPDPETLLEAVKDGRTVHGDMLFTRCVRQGLWAITGRRRIRLERDRVRSISEPMWKFVEERMAA